MELCKKLADELVIYAVRLPEGLERDKYRKSVERWQVRRNREIILKDAAGVYPIKLTRFVEEQLTSIPNGEVRAEEVYQEYRDWCQRNGQYADAYPAFKQGMTAYAEIKKKRPRGAGKAVNPTVMLCGVQLKMESY